MHAKRLIELSLSLAIVIGCASANDVAQRPQELPTSLEKISDLVYARRGSALDPKVTKELLQRMLDIYSEGVGHVANLLRGETRDLIMLSKLRQDRCTSTAFTEIRAQISRNHVYKTNLLPYLRQCLEDRINYCKPIFEERMQTALTGLAGPDIEDLGHLETAVNQAQESRLRREMEAERVGEAVKGPTRSLVSDGIVDYLVQQANKAQRPTGKFKISRKQLDSVFNLCSRVEKSLKEAVDAYSTLMRDRMITDHLSQDTRDWVMKYKLCKDILLDTGEISREVLMTGTSSTLSSNSGGSGSKCGLLSCFG